MTPSKLLSLPLIRLNEVVHVGSLDIETRTARASLEGPCLSVSLDPEAWSGIARIGGPEWLLTRQGALWLDACSLNDAQERDVADWAIAEGLLEERDVWRAWHFDGEADDWGFSRHPTEEAARYEVEGDDVEDAPTETGDPVEVEHGVVLTEKGMSLLERWSEPIDGLDGAIILAGMALAEISPDVCGIWWDEDDNPLSLSCPRGGIFPSRVSEFEAVNPTYGKRGAGFIKPFTAAISGEPAFSG